MPFVKSAPGFQFSHGRTQSLGYAEAETRHPPHPRSEFLPRRISVVGIQLLSHVRLFAIPWIAARQASLTFSISRSFLKLMPVKSVMPSHHLLLCHPLLLLPSTFPSIRVFSNESAVRIRWPKDWSFSFRSWTQTNGCCKLLSLGEISYVAKLRPTRRW